MAREMLGDESGHPFEVLIVVEVVVVSMVVFLDVVVDAVGVGVVAFPNTSVRA